MDLSDATLHGAEFTGARLGFVHL
ncbi:hypothetical protein ABTX99_20485 [Streptomyces flaveolus]